ncbi:DUF433 domain-containing protein [Anatilimnocola sp. NA78]|uniref:DUF433 domain-containing protein n=1 Tax=Anatilimnocola sp. NA78 TaxID=3415683 RepID=UPI003CE54246
MQVSTEHLALDDKGIAGISGSRIKVMHVAMRAQSGMTAEQIHQSYPHLSLGQIHAALAYYYDHRSVIDEQIRESEEIADAHFTAHDQSEFAARIRERAKKL